MKSACVRSGRRLTALVDPAISLSVREREVYDLVCEGLSNAEIARRSSSARAR